MLNYVPIGYYFTIWSLNLFFLYIILNYKNLKFKHLIDEITIDFWHSGNFANIEDIRKKNIRTKFGYKLTEKINMATYFENIIVRLHFF